MAEAHDTNLLGEFLRVRRSLAQPGNVGATGPGRRRVRGLRREEVASLADVSIDYYTHLEQGRFRHPSAEVIQALARVLDLDDDAVAYVRQLSAPPPHRRPALGLESASPGLVRVLETWATTPALLQGSFQDVLACTGPFLALHPGLLGEQNMLRLLFLDHTERLLYPEWEKVAREAVAWLRTTAAAELDNPRLAELVEELEAKSSYFAQMWAQHEVGVKAAGRHTVRHTVLGEGCMDYETFSVNSCPGQSVTVYHFISGENYLNTLAPLARLATRQAKQFQCSPAGVVLFDRDHLH
jgi:transcriptional regulator with XRE-family HTH domain